MELRQIPCGAIATAFQPYPSESTADTIAPIAFPVCKHGGWQECGLQSEQLCVKNVTGDPYKMAALVDCHFDAGAAGGAGIISPTTGSDCAKNLSIPYKEIYECAFEGQYPVPYGKGLLLGAFSEQLARGVKTVPTMFLNGKETMAWSSSASLLKAICEAYTGPAPPKGCAASNVAKLDEEWEVRDTQRCQIMA